MHIAREASCEINSVAVFCAALYEHLLEILQRHLVVGRRIEARIVRHECHKSLSRRGLCWLVHGRKLELFVPSVEVKQRWLVQTCENGLRRELCWCVRLKRWVWCRGRRVR